MPVLFSRYNQNNNFNWRKRRSIGKFPMIIVVEKICGICYSRNTKVRMNRRPAGN